MKYKVVVILLCCSSLMMAQNIGKTSKAPIPAEAPKERLTSSQSPKDIAKSNADKLSKSIKLTEQQSQEVHQAFLEYELAMDKLSKSNLTKKEQFTKSNQHKRKRQLALKSTLTKEQYKTYMLSFP